MVKRGSSCALANEMYPGLSGLIAFVAGEGRGVQYM